MSAGRGRRYGTLTAALVAVGLALTACEAATTTDAGSGPSAASTPAPTSSPTPTATPTPAVQPTPASSDAPGANLTIPTEPTDAHDQTRAGLQAFTEHWLQLLSYSYEANDLEPLKSISDPTCQFCKESEAAMKQIYQLGWAVGGATTLTGFATDFTSDPAGTYTADITTTQAEIFYFSGEGWLGSSESRPDTAHTVTARYADGRWQMMDYTTPAAPVGE
jgi:hypothetical protein